MKFILKINGTESPKAAYIGWTPVKCTLTIDSYKGKNVMPVTITTGHYNGKGKISLFNDSRTSSEPVDKIEHDFQKQNELKFYIAGLFGHASIAEKDTYINVKAVSDTVEELEKKIMVRVRKNANELKPIEVECFLKSFVKLSKSNARDNYPDAGDKYTIKPTKLLDEIVLMHTLDAANEIHRRISFHPWHRAFLMHLERELQKESPEVTIPYWKYDNKEGAKNVFSPKFIGKTDFTQIAEPEKPENINYGEKLQPKFDQTNPMYTYAKHIFWGGALKRAYRYKNLDPSAHKPNNNIGNEKQIICGVEGHPISTFAFWAGYEEVNSHNKAHFAFTGHVVNIGKDPVDPLFFMMHSNVDRLWALWQQEYNRFDGNDEKTYPYQGKYKGERGEDWAKFRKLNDDGFYNVGNCDIGNFAEDTMWPWDLDHELGRPMRKWDTDNLGGHEKGNVPQINIKFPSSITSNYPKGSITVKSTIDYQGSIDSQTTQGFDYDTIPYFDYDKKLFCDIPMKNVQDYNKAFVNNNLSLFERLKAAEQAFFINEDEQADVLKIIKNKEEEKEIRLKAIGLIDETNSSFLDNALEMIADESESTDLRSELIHMVFASKRSNLHFPSRKPRFFDLLRGLIRSSNKQLRYQAIDILSAHEDEVVQDFLIQELTKDKNEFVSKQDAIFFLRENSKPQHAKLFRELFERSNDPDVRKAAIEGLGNDPESIDLLQNVVMNVKENFKVREAGALSLHHLDHEIMNDLAAQIIAEPEIGDGIKLFREISPSPDEVDFKAGLLNMLTFTSDTNRLKLNSNLQDTLKELTDSNTDVKANFQNSFEVFSSESIQGPTVIEQLATKLLNILEESEDD